jgi:hypothetical protein
VSALHHLQHLRLFCPLTRQSQDGISGVLTFDVVDAQRIINTSITRGTLRSLCLPGHCIGELPVRTFTVLAELDICVFNTLNGLELVFHHAASLTSLSLTGLRDSSVFQMFRENPSAFPCLTSFRLFAEVDTTQDHWDALSEFLHGRNIRRLDIDLWAPWIQVSSILPVIGNLHTLQTLGLNVGHEVLEVGDLAHLASQLPATLQTVGIRLPDDIKAHTLSPLVSAEPSSIKKKLMYFRLRDVTLRPTRIPHLPSP